MMHRTLLCLAFVGLVGVEAGASTVIARSDAELARRADVLAVGTVIDTRTIVTARKVVFTLARFEVYEGLAGAEAGDIVTVRVPGGGPVQSGMVAITPEAPRLRAGQMWLGFFHRSAAGYLMPLGLSHGLLPVTRDEAGALRVRRDVDGLAYVKPDGSYVAGATFIIDEQLLAPFVARLTAFRDRPALELPAGTDSVGGVSQ